jgi:diguanylate cyclase (GGDEF)-like protein
MAEFKLKELEIIKDCMHWFMSWFNNNLIVPLHTESNYLPVEIKRVQTQINEANDMLNIITANSSASSYEIDNTHMPVIKQAILYTRKRKATMDEKRKEHIQDSELIQLIQKEMEPIDALTQQDWFIKTRQLIIPRLTSFLSLQRAIQVISQSEPGVVLSDTIYDEKFHILRAPELFLKDVNYFRQQCILRDTALAVAFIDIDKFKDFNSQYTNECVDRNILPRFMETIESHVFGRGFGYRQGGDEYLILLPSVSTDNAIELLDELRIKLSSLSYTGVDRKTTVSIGLVHVDQDCFLTDREIREKANMASVYAKDPKSGLIGRNCIATYKGLQFRENDLCVVRPSPEASGVKET